MVNYQNGKIYKLVNSYTDIVYIGSTCPSLARRMACHRSHARSMDHGQLYPVMREIGIEKFKIILIKEYPCQNKIQLEAEEYRILDQMLKDGIQVYNSIIGGKHNDAMKAKLSAAKTGSCASAQTRLKMSKSQKSRERIISRGSVARHEHKHSWIFTYYERAGKQVQNGSYSYRKYGEHLAKFFALVAQEMKYPSGATTDQILELSK